MAEKVVRTICFDSHSKCGVLVHVDGDRITRVEGDPNHPCSRGMVCLKGLSAQQIHSHPDRLKYPLKRKGPRGSGEWEQISWDEALNEIETRLKEIQDKYGPEAILTGQGTGRGSNHWHARLSVTLGHKGFGVAPIHVCLMPNLMPTVFTFGNFAFLDAMDVQRANTIVEWGINPATAWPGMQMPQFAEARARGAKVIVVDPRFTDMAAKADIWLQPRPGTDGALALGMMNVIINEGLYDKEFVDKWTIGFDQLRERVQEYPLDRVSEITWVPQDKIAAAARLMATNKPTTAGVSLGACMHSNGMQSGRAINCLLAILGVWDVPGGILSNRFWDIMLDPRITLIDQVAEDFKLLGHEDYPLLEAAGSAVPHLVWRAINTEKPKPVKALVLAASDPPMVYAEAMNVREALSNLDFLVVKDYFMTPSAELADIVLPSAHWTEREVADEELYPAPMVVAPQKAVEPPGEAWDDWKFFLELGKRFKPEWWPWNNVREMWLWRLKTFYGWDVTWEEFVEKGYWTYDYEYKKYEAGKERLDGELGFRTPSGKIELYCESWAQFGYDPLPDYQEPAESPYSLPAVAQEYPLILTTGGRLYPFYHSAWTNIPMQREFAPYPFVEMHPDTATSLGISEGEWVYVESPRGRIKVKASLTKGIQPQVVHIPRPGWKHACKELGLEGYSYDKANPNVLLPAEPADPGFATTAMRSTLCRIKKAEVS